MHVCIDQPYPYSLDLTDKGWSSIGRTGLADKPLRFRMVS